MERTGIVTGVHYRTERAEIQWQQPATRLAARDNHRSDALLNPYHVNSEFFNKWVQVGIGNGTHAHGHRK